MEAPSPKASMDLLSRADLLEPALLRAAATLGVADVLAEEPANAILTGGSIVVHGGLLRCGRVSAVPRGAG